MRGMKASAADIGARIRSQRLARGWTQSELAEHAAVHRSVVARAEAGGECRRSSLRKLALTLGVTLTWIDRPFLGPEPYRLDRAADTLWVASNPSYVRRKGLSPALHDPAERARLGSLGLANAFIRVLNNDLPGGRIHGLVVESYRREQDPVAFPGQMFLLVLSGRIRLTLGPDEVVMETGDTISYWADVPNLYEAIGEGEFPPARILEIFVDLSDAEMAVRDQFLGSSIGSDTTKTVPEPTSLDT